MYGINSSGACPVLDTGNPDAVPVKTGSSVKELDSRFSSFVVLRRTGYGKPWIPDLGASRSLPASGGAEGDQGLVDSTGESQQLAAGFFNTKGGLTYAKAVKLV